MYQRKTPKSESELKGVYIAHNPHTIPLENRKWENMIRVISVDPGITHYAIRVEERSIKNPGPIKTLLFDKVGLKKEEQELNKDLVNPWFSYISNFLDQHIALFKTCHMVIIEKQLPVNYRAVRMSQHTLTYFMIHMKNISTLPMFFEVDPKLKGRELGATPHLNDRGIKLWAVEKARELLMDRNDKEGLAVLDRKDPKTKRKEKKDDLSDTVCQIEAMFSVFGWPLTPKPVKLTIAPPTPSVKNSTSNGAIKLNIVSP